MGLLEDKKTAAALIIKRIGSPSSDFDSMKQSNEEMKQVATDDTGAERDSSVGLNAAVDEMMSAAESKNSSKFKAALTSFLEMWMDERED